MSNAWSILSRAKEIRLRGEMAGWSIERIVAAIRAGFHEMTLLLARRLAHGWICAQLANAPTELYNEDGLMAPTTHTSETCRWERGIHLSQPRPAAVPLPRVPDEAGSPRLRA